MSENIIGVMPIESAIKLHVENLPTLRDYFAAAAMQAYRTYNGQWYAQHGSEFCDPEAAARWAYADADAMLAERDK